MTCGIYQIKIGSRVYIGSSVEIEYRWYCHRLDLRKGDHTNRLLQNLWNKHGADASEWSIIELCSKENLLVREQFWIDSIQLENRINLSSTAGRPPDGTGRRHSKESRQRMSDLAKTRPPISEETRQRMSEAKKRSGHTPPSRKGITLSEEVRQEMSRSRLGRKHHRSEKENK